MNMFGGMKAPEENQVKPSLTFSQQKSLSVLIEQDIEKNKQKQISDNPFRHLSHRHNTVENSNLTQQDSTLNEPGNLKFLYNELLKPFAAVDRLA